MSDPILDKMLADWDAEEKAEGRKPVSPINAKENVVLIHPKAPAYSVALSPLQQLNQYSLTGQSTKLRQQMLADQFVLENIAVMGQWTTIYGAPNSGKTLITNWLLRESLVSGAIDGEQVNYINRGMVNFGNSQLIPAHYVTFTLFSVLATSTFYQEFEVDEPLHLHFFVDGIPCLPSSSSP